MEDESPRGTASPHAAHLHGGMVRGPIGDAAVDIVEPRARAANPARALDKPGNMLARIHAALRAGSSCSISRRAPRLEIGIAAGLISPIGKTGGPAPTSVRG